jgi:hypothetical protein
MQETDNLAKHGWHNCLNCNHRWISNIMLQSALPQKSPPIDEDKVIDLAECKGRRE